MYRKDVEVGQREKINKQRDIEMYERLESERVGEILSRKCFYDNCNLRCSTTGSC